MNLFYKESKNPNLKKENKKKNFIGGGGGGGGGERGRGGAE